MTDTASDSLWKYTSLADLKSWVEDIFGNSDDLAAVSQELYGTEGLLCYLTTLTNSSYMMDNIIKPVTLLNRLMPDTMGEALPDILRSQVFAGMTTILEDRLPEIPKLISQGYAALFIMGVNKALLIDVKALEQRSIAEPTSQNVIQGPKDGFTESAETNVSLIRRRIMNERLHIERFEKGNGTRTAIYLFIWKARYIPVCLSS